MILSLDHVQRMNVCGLLGIQKANVSEMRAYWRLLDTIELTADEKAELEYYEAGNGKPLPGWNPEKKIAPREFEFSDADSVLITRAVESYQFQPGNDRVWLEPLLAQLPPAATNGHAPGK
jgi:hypothetical protein